ncbi:MAG: excisionase family DNA-binding protein [Bryobacteraceae bacterium]
MKPLISVRQFSQVTGIGYKRSRQLVSSGTIPSKQVGRRRLISIRWLDRWLEEGAAGDQVPISIEADPPGEPR